MMIPGSIDGNNNWVEGTSLARAVEDAMVAAGVLHLDKEAKATTKDRRKGFVAIATGLIGYLQQNMDLQFAAAALHTQQEASLNVPTAAKTITQAVK